MRPTSARSAGTSCTSRRDSSCRPARVAAARWRSTRDPSQRNRPASSPNVSFTRPDHPGLWIPCASAAVALRIKAVNGPTSARLGPVCHRLRDELLLHLAVLGLERLAEIARLEDGADLHLGLLERSALEPLDGLFLRLHLPDPVARHQLLRFGEGPVENGLLPARKPDPRALRAGAQP